MRHEISFFIGCMSTQKLSFHEFDKVIDGIDIEMALRHSELTIKPHLKSFGNITEDELMKVVQAKYNRRRVDIKRLESSGTYCAYSFYDTQTHMNSKEKLDLEKLSPSQVTELIKLRIDIFGLIQDGEAIEI